MGESTTRRGLGVGIWHSVTASFGYGSGGKREGWWSGEGARWCGVDRGFDERHSPGDPTVGARCAGGAGTPLDDGDLCVNWVACPSADRTSTISGSTNDARFGYLHGHP